MSAPYRPFHEKNLYYAKGPTARRPAGRDLAGALGIRQSGGGGSWISWRGGAIVAAALVALWLGYGLLTGSGSDQGLRYSTVEAKRGGLVVTVSATGTVEPINQVEISSELSGSVKRVAVDNNDVVRKGQLLAEFDTEKLEAEIAHSRAELSTKQAQVAEAEATVAETMRDLERNQSLVKRKVVSEAMRDSAQASYDRALASLAAARAAVVVAEADLLINETELRKAVIYSPIDGIVLKRDVEPGQTIAASFAAPTLFTVAEDLASMRLEVDIDEADVGAVAVGQAASFTVEAYQNKVFGARVEEILYASERTDDGVVTYTAELRLDNSKLLLRPGMTASADIIVQLIKDATLIPNAALRYTPPETGAEEKQEGGRSLLGSIVPHPSGGGQAPGAEAGLDGTRRIWVMRGDEPEAVSVRTGASDGRWTEVVEGEIGAGDAIVTSASAGE